MTRRSESCLAPNLGDQAPPFSGLRGVTKRGDGGGFSSNYINRLPPLQSHTVALPSAVDSSLLSKAEACAKQPNA